MLMKENARERERDEDEDQTVCIENLYYSTLPEMGLTNFANT